MKRITFAITVLAALALAIPAAAGTQSSQKGAKSNQADFSGTVGQCRTVQIKGEKDRHVVGKCRADDGRIAVINFGREQDLRRSGASVKPGDRVQAIGLVGRMNGHPVLIVDRFRTDAGQRTAMQKTSERQRSGDRQRSADRQRDARSKQGSESMRHGRKVHMFPAKIVDMRDVTLKGVGEKHRLIKVDTGRQKPVVVDLGTGEPLSGLKLKKGDRVVIHGVEGRMNDRPVIYATQIADVAVIETPAGPAKRPQARQTRNIQRVPQMGNR